MKKFIFFFLFFNVLGWSEQVFSPQELLEIQKRLDLIMIEIRYLPEEKKRNIYNYVLDIKGILSGEKQFTNLTAVKTTFPDDEMNDLLRRLGSLTKYEERKTFIKAISKNKRFYMKQVVEIMKHFVSYTPYYSPSDRKEIMLLILPDVVDPENIDLLIRLLKNEEDIKNINEIIK